MGPTMPVANVTSVADESGMLSPPLTKMGNAIQMFQWSPLAHDHVNRVCSAPRVRHNAIRSSSLTDAGLEVEACGGKLNVNADVFITGRRHAVSDVSQHKFDVDAVKHLINW